MAMQPTARDVFYIVLALIIACLNTVETVLILRTNIKKAFEKLLLSLAVSDVFVGLTVAALKIVDLATHNTMSWLEGGDFAIIFIISSNLSISNLILITVDRFLAVRFPIKHRILLTERRVNATIALVWFLSAVSMIHLSIIKYELKRDYESLLAISGLILLLGVIMVVLYIKIFYLISKRTVTGSADGEQGKKVTMRSIAKVVKGPHVTERGVFITGAIVTISFIICTYPFALNFLIIQSAEETSLFSKVMLLLNSLFNPFIYFFKGYLGPKRGRQTTEVITMN